MRGSSLADGSLGSLVGSSIVFDLGFLEGMSSGRFLEGSGLEKSLVAFVWMRPFRD